MSKQQIDLTQGKVTSSMMRFALPMILGNLLQQFYNIADTWIVGRFVGSQALASVGSAYSLMTFVTSVLIGLCMGCGSLFSYDYGAGNKERFVASLQTSFVLVGGFSVVLCIGFMAGMKGILHFLNIPEELFTMMYHYVQIVMPGILFIFLYNFYAYVLRSVGNSMVPLYFLGVSSVLNIGLDILFVVGFGWSLEGAAVATLISQIVAGVGLMLYAWKMQSEFRIHLFTWRKIEKPYKEVFKYSVASSLQQSVMNFGILLVQGMVNSFGTMAMAAFAAAVKIDTLAYMPAQEYANAYSIFVSQNFGAGEKTRIRKGTKSASIVSLGFCALVSVVVVICARYLLYIFIDSSETGIIAIGMNYLHIEGAFYIGIGLLFLWYAYFRGTNRPQMSLVLTIISLGTRVVIAWISTKVPVFGLNGIWWAVPIGWFLADVVGLIAYKVWKIK